MFQDIKKSRHPKNFELASLSLSSNTKFFKRMSLLFDYGLSISVASLMTADICNQFKELGKCLHLTYLQFVSQIGLGQEQNFLNGCLCFLLTLPD